MKIIPTLTAIVAAVSISLGSPGCHPKDYSSKKCECPEIPKKATCEGDKLGRLYHKDALTQVCTESNGLTVYARVDDRWDPEFIPRPAAQLYVFEKKGDKQGRLTHYIMFKFGNYEDDTHLRIPLIYEVVNNFECNDTDIQKLIKQYVWNATFNREYAPSNLVDAKVDANIVEIDEAKKKLCGYLDLVVAQYEKDQLP